MPDRPARDPAARRRRRSTRFATATAASVSPIMLHNDGQREIYFFRHGDDDEPAAVIDSTTTRPDSSARHGRGVRAAEDRRGARDGARGSCTIEWVPVPDDSPAIGKTLAECGFRAKSGITVIAILREPEPVTRRPAGRRDPARRHARHGRQAREVRRLPQAARRRHAVVRMDLLCSVDVAAVRAEPRDDAERVTELLRGEPVRVDEHRDGWTRIRTAYDYPGWVREEDLAGARATRVEQARGPSARRISGAA